MMDPTRICIIAGDFNLNFKTDSNNVIIKELLKTNFTQMIDEPTHMQGGIIDHLYVRCPTNYYGIEIHSDIMTPF